MVVAPTARMVWVSLGDTADREIGTSPTPKAHSMLNWPCAGSVAGSSTGSTTRVTVSASSSTRSTTR